MLSAAVMCMALNIYHEARDQSNVGQAAVAYTVLNRAGGRKDKICDTVLNDKQYSWTNGYYKAKDKNAAFEKLKPTDPIAWKRATLIAELAMRGGIRNPIGKANHYYNPKKANPSWASEMKLVASIGEHRFYYSDKFKTV